MVTHFFSDKNFFVRITKKTPKILFNLRAFNNYYAQGSLDEIFGCRFNIIKKEFESLLSSLKFAGADLVFVSKQNHIDISQDVRFSWLNEEYQQGLKFVEILTKNNSLHEVSLKTSRGVIFHQHFNFR